MKQVLALLYVVFASFFGFCLSMAAEPNYPTRPIELMVGAGPGGGTDLGARMISEVSKKDLGQELVVVDKPGGGSRVAYTLLAKADPRRLHLAVQH